MKKDSNIVEFILENIDKDDLMLENYKVLNRINTPDKIKKFPYNILSLEVTPTYKTINLKYVKDKDYYVDNVKHINGSGEVFVFLY